MSRRSARLGSKPTVTFNDLDSEACGNNDYEFKNDHLNDVDLEESTSKTLKKRKKKSSVIQADGDASQKVKHFRGRRGKLRQLPEMPIDILYEIFGHLRPSDLLRLARTTKALRDTLLRRSARSVWKDALANIEDLPECPNDLNEPQFASLVFAPFCHFCGAPNSQAILWSFRVRSCQKCIGTRFMDTGGLYFHLNKLAIDVNAWETYIKLFPAARSKYGTKHRLRVIFLVSNVQDTCAKLEELKNDAPALEKFIDEKTKENEALQSYTNLCEEWYLDAGDERLNDLGDLKQRRKDQIFQRLRDAGWGEDLDKNDDYELRALTTHASVKKAQELTDRIWSNIESTLTEIMTALHTKRLQRERFTILTQRHKIVSELVKAYRLNRLVGDVTPSLADVCEMHEFKTIIWDTPLDVEVDERTFQPAMEQLPRLIDKWRDEKDAELLHMIDPSFTLDKDRSKLNLATTLFGCTGNCRYGIAYPRILFHLCTTDYSFTTLYAALDNMLDRIWRSSGCQTWNYGQDRVSVKDRTLLEDVVKCCGMDPVTTTAEQMDKLGPRLECTRCYSLDTGHELMDWRNAVNHDLMWPLKNHTPKWKLVNDRDTARVKEIEREKEKDSNPLVTWSQQLHCARCREKVYGPRMGIHLQQIHAVANITTDDYYISLDYQKLTPVVRMLDSELSDTPIDILAT